MTQSDHRGPWWKGARGEWLVVHQLALMALVFFGPRSLGASTWKLPFPLACRIIGVVFLAGGGLVLFAGIFRLGRGRGLTPLPYPREEALLVESGVYGVVRHPIYGGGFILALGWALLVRSWLTLGYVLVLFVFLDLKSRLEEKWLVRKFPKYVEYQRRVRKLVPFIY